MKNRELKKGGQIWIYCPYLGKSESWPITSVKKAGTLVTVVIRRKRFREDRFDDITLYGHASSALLSGYDKAYNFGNETYYTCDFDLIEKWTKDRERDSKYEEIGRNLKTLIRSLGI